VTLSYTITNNTISIFSGDKRFTLTPDDANFSMVKQALLDKKGDNEVLDLLDHSRLVRRWSGGAYWLNDSQQICDSDGPLPDVLHLRIMAMIRDNQKPTALFNFWARLKNNPSNRSVTQLWDFLQHAGIPLTDGGFFLAYKSVRPDLLDHHSGKWENRPGKVLSMPRNKISDDPRTPCHEGFHVGALSYAQTFGSEKKIVICKVDPEDVVCVPYDESHRKMRVCRYEVVGFHGADLPSSVMHDADLPSPNKVVVASLAEETQAQKDKPKQPVNRLSDEELLSMSLEDLRSYASRELHLVGASKVPGGRWALLELIMSNY
jgi:hypothetical protein